MTLEDEIREEVVKKLKEDFNIEKIEVKIIMQDKLPQPSELASRNETLTFIGKIKGRFTYLVKKVLQIVAILSTLVNLPDNYNKINIFIPKTFEFVTAKAEEISKGNYVSLQSEKEQDGYLVFRQGWANNRQVFEKDFSSLQKGDWQWLYYPDAAYIPASSSSGSVTDGTTALSKFKIEIKT